jgi:hypothetical protein
VGRIGESLQIDELMDYDDNNNNNNNNNNINISNNRNSLNALMVQNMQIRQQLASDHEATLNIINNFNTDINNKLNIMNDNIK